MKGFIREFRRYLSCTFLLWALSVLPKDAPEATVLAVMLRVFEDEYIRASKQP